MSKLKLDENGIPVLSRSDIEEKAEQFLKFFDESCLKRPKFSPLHKICSRLNQEYGVTFALEADLGYSPEGYKYRGRFHIPSRTILIDKSLKMEGPRFNFTLAHEIAHFVLHRSVIRSVIKNEDDTQISDTSRQLILDHVQSNNPRDWLEWQANKYASSLLLPRFTVQMAVVEKQKEMGINGRLGSIFHDDQPKNRIDFHTIMEHLGNIFITSRSATRIRLRELNVLIERATASQFSENKAIHVSHVLSDVLGSIAEKHK